MALAEFASKFAPVDKPNPIRVVYDTESANEAVRLLGIASTDPALSDNRWRHDELKLETWAVQAAISRPGRRAMSQQEIETAKSNFKEPDKLKWPKVRAR